MGRAHSPAPSSRRVTVSRVSLGVEALGGRHAPSALLDPLPGEPAPAAPAALLAPPAAVAAAPVAAVDATAEPAPLVDPAPGVTVLDHPLDGPGLNFVPPPANQPPRVANFMAVEVAGGAYEFSGDVFDEAPAGLTVTLGGEPGSLQGVTTTTDAAGHFVVAVLVRTDGSDNGLATAQTTDAGGLASNVASYAIWPG